MNIMKRVSAHLKKIQVNKMKTLLSQAQTLIIFLLIKDNLINKSQITLMFKMKMKKIKIRDLNNLMSIHRKRKRILNLILV